MRRLSSFSVRTRLLAAVGISALAAVVVGVFGMSATHAVFDRGNSIYEQGMVPNAEVAKIRESVLRYRFDSLSADTSVRADAKQANLQLANGEKKALEDALASYEVRNLSPAERSALNEFKGYWAQYLKLRIQSGELRAQGRNAEADVIKVEKIIPTTKTMMAALDKLYVASDTSAKATVHNAKSTYSKVRTWGVVVPFVGVLISLVVALIIARTIISPLRRVQTVLKAVADGDLTQRADVTSSDEVGQMATALNATLGTVHDVIREIEKDAAELSTYATRVAASNSADHTLAGRVVGEVSQIRGHYEAIERLAGVISDCNTGTEADAPASVDVMRAVAGVLEQTRALQGSLGSLLTIGAETGDTSGASDANAAADQLAEMAQRLDAMITVFNLEPAA